MHRSFRIPFLQPVLTGLDLAREAAEDFESFFIPGHQVRVRIETDANRPYPLTRGKGEATRVILPTWLADQIIRSSDQFFFHLFMLGHEIAHVVHFHNDGPEQDEKDYQALEMWADFYGAKVMMCLITYGKQVGRSFRTFFLGTGFEKPLEAMGRAAGQLIKKVFVEHPLYPYPLLRVGLLTNGIHSFLRRELRDPPDIWPYSVFRRMFGSPPVREQMLLHPEHIAVDFAPVERAREWHRAMQKNAVAIRPWLKPQFVHHLHTSFQQTLEEREFSRLERVRELKAMGFLEDD